MTCCDATLATLAGIRMVNPIDCINIRTSPMMADRVQVRFPRSKKRRIRRKWAKDPRNYRTVPSDEVWIVEGILVMHPAKLAQIRRDVDALFRTQVG